MGRILSGFLGLKSKGQVMQGIEIANDQWYHAILAEYLVRITPQLTSAYQEHYFPEPSRYFASYV